MNQQELESVLANLNLSAIHFFDSIGSTNDEAMEWAKKGARDLSLVVADEQTMGRGRLDRPWFTPPRTALAFSLILRPTAAEKPLLSRTVGLAALALSDVLQTLNLDPQIKWPNDILLNGRKLAGILIEATWFEEEAQSIVIGMGGDGSPAGTTMQLIDPADGAIHDETYEVFVRRYTNVAVGEMEANQPFRAQIVHW